MNDKEVISRGDDDIPSILTDSTLNGCVVRVVRKRSVQEFKFIACKNRGMKGVVWQGLDDLGYPVAIKLVPTTEYNDHSLLDEMTYATKLVSDNFSQIKFFGDAEVLDVNIPQGLKCIVSEWIDGERLDSFLERETLSVDDFIAIAEQLFRSIAVLRQSELCHDDLHPGNILLQRSVEPLTGEFCLTLKIVDTGSLKRKESRENRVSSLRSRLQVLIEGKGAQDAVQETRQRLARKELDDHLRVVEALLIAANSLTRVYSRLDFWERKFVDGLKTIFDRLTDEDLERRLDEPSRVVAHFYELVRASKRMGPERDFKLSSPFDYISAEMIQNDREFMDLFSRECPWLEECKSIEPLYIYGPRGCGKSSMLRWLSFKVQLSNPARKTFDEIREVGVYVSCSVELRARFWLLDKDAIERFQSPSIRYFSLLLLEELVDTLNVMLAAEVAGIYDFALKHSDQRSFVAWCIKRIMPDQEAPIRLQGQGYFVYLKSLVRRFKWETWAEIQGGDAQERTPDPSIIADICKSLPEYFPYFKDRHITFLLDDYSNQRIPADLQRKLNQTISFAKQGTPIFKVSSEYLGVDLDGIQEGREVVEINVGSRYTSLEDQAGATFLIDIINIRLAKAGFKERIEGILGRASYDGRNMPKAIAQETSEDRFYYHGIDTVHWLCSGDLALALDVVRTIFERNGVDKERRALVAPHAQHESIQQFSHEEIRRIKNIVPFGERMHDIVCYLGYLARAFVVAKASNRSDKLGEPACRTHLDIRFAAVRQLEDEGGDLALLYRLLTSRAILLTLNTSRSRIEGSIERLQMKRIFFPAFKAPVKRDTPIKVDDLDELKSLLVEPRSFVERELSRASLGAEQLTFAMEISKVRPRS